VAGHPFSRLDRETSVAENVVSQFNEVRYEEDEDSEDAEDELREYNGFFSQSR
jgi:hypothetical protein